MKRRWLLLTTLLVAWLVSFGCGVSQSRYEEAQSSLADCQREASSLQAEKAALTQEKEALERRLAEAGRWAAVLDVLLNHILAPSLSLGEGYVPPGGYPNPLQLMEEAIRASGDLALIGRFELFKDATQAEGGPSIMALVELAEAVEASGTQQLVEGFSRALDTPIAGTPFTLGSLVGLGKAVRATGDPALEEMMGKMFTGQEGQTALTTFIAYTTSKLSETLR